MAGALRATSIVALGLLVLVHPGRAAPTPESPDSTIAAASVVDRSHEPTAAVSEVQDNRTVRGSATNLHVTAGPTTITLNVTSGGLLSVKRTSASSVDGVVEFLSSATAGEEPLFTLGLTRLSDLGGPLRVMSTDFRKVTCRACSNAPSTAGYTTEHLCFGPRASAVATATALSHVEHAVFR
jgi:hypothetical protein